MKSYVPGVVAGAAGASVAAVLALLVYSYAAPPMLVGGVCCLSGIVFSLPGLGLLFLRALAASAGQRDAPNRRP